MVEPRRVTDGFSEKRAVFFDAGFTLLELTAPVRDVYLEAAEAVGAKPPEAAFDDAFARLWPRLIGDYRSKHPELESSEELERAAWRAFTGRLAAEFPPLAARHDDWHRRLVEHFDAPSAWRPRDGTYELLDDLRALGWKIGVVSNWHSALHGILAGHDLARRCDFVLTSSAAGRKKPHPEIFRQALALAGVGAESAVHVGDSWHEDVEGARGAGLSAVWLSKSMASHVGSGVWTATSPVEVGRLLLRPANPK
jgi:putative hydrolase of the HAD superfamily